ncbi:hypothetical protein D3C80_1211920 [compost metagenome]
MYPGISGGSRRDSYTDFNRHVIRQFRDDLEAGRSGNFAIPDRHLGLSFGQWNDQAV